MLLPDAAKILNKAVLCMVVRDRHIKFTLSADTCAIDDCNAKFKVAVLRFGKQDWKAPQIKDLQLVITSRITAGYSL